MNKHDIKKIIKHVLENLPEDWLKLTTHRIDIYNEKLAKTQFLEAFEKLGMGSLDEFSKLPTAFDYIRLGHPLSCLLEWAIAKMRGQEVDSVISFSSQTMPILAVLRKNLINNIKTQIVYKNDLPEHFNAEVLKSVYGYHFELVKINGYEEIQKIEGSTLVVTEYDEAWSLDFKDHIDFIVSIHPRLGSVIQVHSESKSYIKEIQHVRRRESIAMTPQDCFAELEHFVGLTKLTEKVCTNKEALIETIQKVTHTENNASISSCGLSVQYAIMMGLIHHSFDHFAGKKIKFIVPPNCYGGTNDQARRVAACIENVEILDLPVDDGKNMVDELEKVLEQVALEDAVPFIIAEIPTNPRVEVPDLVRLQQTLAKKRISKVGAKSVAPVFILDQTFCPNVEFLGEGDFLYDVQTISYVSGSKFPSGGLCTAGYCVANDKAKALMSYVDNHLKISNNEATDLQIDILSKQMPSMNERIAKAYRNTREFVTFIENTLPESKINFVSENLARAGFTPSVVSLDLPTKGETHEQKETFKRELNLKLINMMISEIPNDSKHCVSYGQLKGCYWTIPATSTQGTTKEGDKDYIVRVSVSGEMDLDKHKQVFSRFCQESF